MNHPYFTQIPLRSFDAIVRNGWLSEILLALIVDEPAAYDVAEVMRRNAKTQGIELDPNPGVEKPYAAPILVADFADLGTWMVDKWRVTLAQWVMQFERARPAITSLLRYDRRFGVWCACQVAREALRFVPNGESRPLIAIETTERWVLGKTTILRVQDAGAAADDAAQSDSGDAYAAYASVYAAWSVYASSVDSAVYASDSAVYAVANAYASASSAALYGSPQWVQKRNEELIRLREVVAHACMTFPI